MAVGVTGVAVGVTGVAVGAVPVVTAISRDKKDPIDEDLFEQKLASAAFLKIELQFARAVP